MLIPHFSGNRGVMFVLVTYDVNTETEQGKKRLRKVARECEKYGQRVQCSVFECVIDPSQCEVLKSTILKIINTDKDSIRFYFLGNKYETKIKEYGRKKGYEAEGTLIF